MKKYVQLLCSAYLKLFFVVMILCCTKSFAAIRYVKTGSAGTAPYTSWATASNDLQAVINACSAGDDIWVAAGTYIPNRRADATGTITTNDRDNAFVLKNGVRIFGGFTGTETATSQRNFATNITILSGDLGTAGSYTDNCYHVVVCAGTVSGTTLNGFYIRYGNANGSGTITVNAVSIGRGSGAGMRINSSSPAISNCVFSANITGNNGGGLVCDGSSPAITNCVFSGNTANDGGAILNTNSSATEITNCTFSGNNATATAGAIRNGNSSSPLISNCIIWGNLAAGIASAIYNADAGSVPDVNYSLVQGGYTGTANVNADPLFVNPVAATLAPTLTGDYRVQKCSPALNGGLNSYVPGSINNDLHYTPRINYGTVDIGAYEKQLTLAVPNASGIVFVDYTKTGNGSSWANAVAELADALVAAKYDNTITQIWVAKGTYYPRYNARDGSSLACDNTNRDNAFVLVNNVKLYGGFNGNEVTLKLSDAYLNGTNLSGDIGVLNFVDDNCHQVVISAGSVGNAELNGFTIINGKGLNSSASKFINGVVINKQCGAGITVHASSPVITNCKISDNQSGSGLTSDGGGGAWIGPGSQPVISKCFFENNYSSLSGGGIFINSGSNTQISDCNLFRNTSDNNGGGAIYVAQNCAPTIRNCGFDDNHADFGGAILNSIGSHTNIIKCFFLGNDASVDGGAIHSNYCSPVIDSCYFTINVAIHWGGGISNFFSSSIITNCNFERNNSLGGGGIHNETSPVTVNDCRFYDNSSSGPGGGIFNINTLNPPYINIKRCFFENNTAGQGGGFFGGSSRNSIIDCCFRGNEATVSSAIGLVDDNSEFVNCLVSGNKGAGSAIRVETNAVSTFSNCTITGNKMTTGTTGSAFNVSGGSTLLLNNSIVWGNEGTAPGASPIVLTGSGAGVNYTLIEGGFAGTGNINTNPLFVNPATASSAPTLTGNYHFQTCSPALNAGNNALIPSGISTDLDSLTRVKFTTVDMGAYEKHLAVPDANGIVYIDSSNTLNAGYGSSWANAATELADALKAAITDTDIEQIWVAKGTYKPLYLSTDNGTALSCTIANRDNAFVLRPGVELYGGFAGGEADTSGRDFATKQTILSGDIGVAANNTDNTYHVLIASGAVGKAVLDGFSVTRGYADANTNYTLNGNIVYRSHGGGIYIHSSSPDIFNCEFTSNYAMDNGGALAALNSSSPFSNNLFLTNTAGKKGGAVSLQNCNTLLKNTIFSANTVNGPGPNNLGGGLYAENTALNVYKSSFTSNTVLNGDGGGVVNDLSAGSVFSSCIFSGNAASNRAGGYYNLSSVSALHNSVFTGNSSGIGGGAGVYNSLGASLTGTNNTISGNKTTGNGGGLLTASPCILGNTIIHDNTATISSNNIYSVFVTPTVSTSIIQGGYAGTGNYDIDPLFVAPVSPAAAPTIAGNYRLQACSPALNLGDNSVIPPGLTKDVDSLDRIKYSTVDMGAYEIQTIDLANSTWRGFNTNWNDRINWCGGYIPYDTTNVTVPVTSNNPVINAGFDNEVNNISFSNNTSIGIANTGKFTINGTYSNLGSTISNNGDWVMAGSAPSQTFPGTLATVSAMNNLEINNLAGVKLDKSFELTGTLTPTAGDIDVDNATITLNSDATATARVAAVPSGVAFSYTGTGKFEVERYIPPHRAWRLLTAPVSSTSNLTISQAWQEGVSNANRLTPVNPAAGFGTTITKSTTYNVTDGYDQGSTNNPSIRYYNGVNWGGFPSGTIGSTPGANNGLINDQQGYMLFVRGDRSIQVAGVGVTATVTTLRPKGQLKTGPQTIVCNGWTVIGNPYASPINFHKIVLDNPGLPDAFYVWDANLAGSSNVGGWVSYGSYNGVSETYTVAPLLSGSTFANNKGDIASASAFMINYTGTVTINENHKSILGDNVLYRPVRQLSINLYVVNADSSESLNDGIAIKMESSPQAANTEKNKNFTENLAIAFDNKLYAIQNRRRPGFNDTIYISTGQMKQRNYVLEIKADDLDMPHSMKAYLEDTYLRQYELIALDGSTRYPFVVNGDSGSVSAARFRLLFKRSAGFNHIHASVKEKDIEVRWEMEETFGIEQYEIERSINGIDFTLMESKSTNRNLQPLTQTQWLDISPATGTYFYRIKATGIDGEVMYSDVAKASMIKNNAGMYIYPNPVTGKQLQLRMNQQLQGPYSATLINSTGQKVFTQQWQHSGGFVTKIFELPGFIAAGIYQLEITNTEGKKQVLTAEIQQ